MPTPSHGLFCSSRTFPTRYKNCGDQIYVYQCSCGSIVLFDELGGDWPQHRMACYLKPGDPVRPTEDERREMIRIGYKELLRKLEPSKSDFVSIEPSDIYTEPINDVMVLQELPKRTQRIERLDK